MPTNLTLAELLEQKRSELGLSRKEFAAWLGVQVYDLQSWISRNRVPGTYERTVMLVDKIGADVLSAIGNTQAKRKKKRRP